MRNLFLFLLSITLVSCLGKVQDANPEITKGVNLGDAVVNFEGIYNAQAIANDKVEVFFYPAQGDSREFTYVVNYDGASFPLTFPGETLRPDYRGLLKVKVQNLEINKNYVFNVQVKNNFGIVSSNDKIISVSTYSNITANFAGIGDCKNLSGADGKNAITVEWPAAERQGSDFLKKEIDPVLYEIVLLDSDSATPVAFDDVTFSLPTRLVNYVDGKKISHQVNGLKPGTKYYVRVRAIHQGYSDYGSSPTYSKETNSDYIVIETLSDQASDVEINLDSFNVVLPSNSTGLTSLKTSWEQGIGAIDHYRVYYKKLSEGNSWAIYKNSRDEVCDGVETNDNNYTCLRVDLESNSRTLADLVPYTEYGVYAVACLNNECGPSFYLEYNSSPPYKTSPPTAPFSGIEEVLSAKYFWSLDEIFLKFTSPNINSGVANGLLVEVKERTTGEPSIDTFLNHPILSNTSSLNISNFDYLNDTVISVKGVDISSDEPYCFSLLPYTLEEGTVVVSRSSEIVKCIKASIELPTADDFEGFNNSVFDASTNTMSLIWNTPSKGVYNKFFIFIRTDGGVFNFGEAVAGNINYLKFEIDYGETDYDFSFLPSGNYTFGILAYLELNNKYSVFNTGLRSVTVP